MEKKEQLAKVEKMLGSYKLAEEKGDQSILRYNIFIFTPKIRSTTRLFLTKIEKNEGEKSPKIEYCPDT